MQSIGPVPVLGDSSSELVNHFDAAVTHDLAEQILGEVQAVIGEVVAHQSIDRECACSEALKSAIITSPERVTEEARERLSLIVGEYLSVAREVV